MGRGRRCPGEYIWGGGAQVSTYGEERKGMGRRCLSEYIWGRGGMGWGGGAPGEYIWGGEEGDVEEVPE